MEQIKAKDVINNIQNSDSGFFYKNDEAFESGNGVCYIDEYKLKDINEKLESEEIKGYTRQDFIDICEGNEYHAECLYYEVDWQEPERLFDEWNLDEEGERRG